MTASSSSSTEALALPTGGPVAGRIRVPSSKSETHRILNLALLSRRSLVVERPLLAEDTRLFLAALETLGFEVRADGRRVTLTPARRPPSAAEISCGNAGTLLRLLIASLATIPGRWRLDGVERLRQRPVGPLVSALRELGGRVRYLAQEGSAPLEIEGGRLAGGRCRLDAGESSQYLSSLLMAGRRAASAVEIEVVALTSEPYVELTLEILERAGVRVERPHSGLFRVAPGGFELPSQLAASGDFSAACYAAAAAAVTGGQVTLSGLEPHSAQGDRAFLDLLGRMGARCRWLDGRQVEVTGGPDLRGLDVDLSGMPDQVPTLAALAPFARGSTRIRNVAHLRIKESDRLSAMATELGRAGAPVEILEDGLVVEGVWADRQPPSEPVRLRSHGDHRIAMSLAVVGLRRPGLLLEEPEVVEKSYPAFWNDWRSFVAP